MRYQLLQEVRDRATEHAAEAFKNHVVTKTDDGWRFAKPGTSIYSSRIITAPGCVIMYGDCGELMIQPNKQDALRWLREVFLHGGGTYSYDIHYIFSKVPSVMKVGLTSYQPELVRRALAAEKELLLTEISKIEDMKTEFERLYAHDVVSYPVTEWWHKSFPCCDESHQFDGISYHFVFQVELLRHFCDKVFTSVVLNA
jgi:hypothetical protein